MAQLRKSELRELTLRENLELHAKKKTGQTKTNIPSQVKAIIKNMEGFETSDGRNILDIPIKELDDSPFLSEFAYESKYSKRLKGKRTGMMTLFTRLNAVFNDAGLADYSNMQARLEAYGKDDWSEVTGYKYYRARLTLVGQPGEQYIQVKEVLTELDGRDKGFLGLKLFSGLRQTDLANANVQNYDRETGRLVFTEGKSKQAKEIILRPGARPFFEMLLGGRESGELVPDKEAIEKRVNEALKAGVSPSVYEDIDKQKIVEPFTLSDLRNSSETILDETGMSQGDKQFVAGRTGTATEQEKYVKLKTRLARIRSKLAQADAKVVGYSNTTDLAQFLSDVGVPDNLINDDARRVVVFRSLLEDDDFLDALDENFLDNLPEEGTGVVAKGSEPTINKELSAEYKETAVEALSQRREEIIKTTLLTRQQNQKLLLENPSLAQPTEIETTQTTGKKAAGVDVEVVDEPVDWSKYSDEFKSKLKGLADRFQTMAETPAGKAAGKTLKGVGVALPYATVTAGALGLADKIQADYARGEGVLGTSPEVSAGLRTSKFALEEFTPPGALIGMAEAKAEAVKKEGTKLLEKSVDMTEDELLRSFGQFGSNIRGY